jgi:hypothetical protein
MDRTGSPVSWCGVTGNGYGSSTTGRNPADQRRASPQSIERITEPPADNVIPLRPQQTFDGQSNVDGVAETAEKGWSSNPSEAVNNLP